jgi:hypothetical protein
MTILMRTMQRNLKSGRDEYLHTNCLASICNMAPHTCYIHEYTAQRLIGLLAGLARRYGRLRKRASSLEVAEQPYVGNTNDVADHHKIDGNGSEPREEFSVDDMATFGEFIRLLLQVISACLDFHNLPENIHLLYALLHDQHVLEPFVGDELFADSVPHIMSLLQHFGVLLPSEGSVESIQYVLRQAARSFRFSDNVVPAPAASIPKFSYEGLPDAESFFLPYTWQLVCESTSISWLRSRAQIFDPEELLDLEPPAEVCVRLFSI